MTRLYVKPDNCGHARHSGFQRDLLVVVGRDSPKGLPIKDELDECYCKEINHGQLYPNLDDPVDVGLVEKGQIDDRTNSYSLTAAGREALAERYEWGDQYVDI